MSPYHNGDGGDSYFCSLTSTTSMSGPPNGSVNKKRFENVRGRGHGHKTTNSSGGSGSSKENFQTLVVQVDIEHVQDEMRHNVPAEEKILEMDDSNSKTAENKDKECTSSSTPAQKLNGQPHPVPTSSKGGRVVESDADTNGEIVRSRSQVSGGASNPSEDPEEISEDSKTKSVSSPNLYSSPTISRRAPSIAASDFSSSATTIYGSCKSRFSTSTDEDEIFYSVDSRLDQTNFSSSSTINAHDDDDDDNSIHELTISIQPSEEVAQQDSERPHTQNGTHSPELNQRQESMTETMSTLSLSPTPSYPSLSTSTLSLPAAAFSHRRPSLTLRIRPSSANYGSIRRTRHQSERQRNAEDGDDDEEFQTTRTSEDPSKIWLYRSKKHDNEYPDIILQVDGDEDDDKDTNDEDELSPVLTPEELLTLAEQDMFPSEIHVYVEYDEGEEKRRPRESERPRRRSFLSFTTDSPIFSARRRARDSTRSAPTPPSRGNDDDLRKESLRKLSNVSRVLIVDEDNAYDDMMQAETHALERRLSRDNLKAINLLTLLGDELSLDSGENTPVGFEYSDNVLKIRFLLAWKAAELEVKHKKTQTETEIPLAATKMYTRPISRCARYIRIFKLKCTNCFFFIFRIRCGCRNYSDQYGDDLVETESVEAFQKELEVMEHRYSRKRHSDKKGTLTGETDSIKKLNELIERGKLRQKKRNYRNALSFR